ncbi:recombinase family protein [Chromobacterium sp. S0633]|uniref:recombinase family protein n=1 Tax=Chromobacterium sp. S0633 TaxID=2957805 RepID=UPI00209E8517|nr:recombinase family protein [Chromobacterium sp. S0633]MCP1289804.1 recombinase family protein [Chromobacterium sp. S0633]
MENPRVYSYLRFSDPRQSDGSSADRQIQYASRWAAEHNLHLDERLSLRDEGLSAYHQRHVKQGALGAFLAAVDGGQIAPGSVLIVEGLDRLSRAEPIQAQAQLAQIINAGITVVTASDGKEYNRAQLKSNPMDLVYSLLVMIRAHEESDTKSKRVKAAILRQIKGWQNGTFRGRIVNGKDPQWLRWIGDGWEVIEERAAAYRIALDMYKKGHGSKPTLEHLAALGLKLVDGGLPHTSNFYRIIRSPALYGARQMELDGQTYLLDGYYPPLITKAEYDEIQAIVGDRVKVGAPPVYQSIITGMAITRCGYCGSALVGQNLSTRKKRDDGMPHNGHRRLHCCAHGRLGTRACPVQGSCSVVPVENAIMEFCSDQLNLSALLDNSDQTTPLRQKLASARAETEALEAQLETITNALLEAGSSAAPRTFLKKASELEASLDKNRQQCATLEYELTQATQRQMQPAAAEQWAALVDGVKALDNTARLTAKKLVADTFERIIVYTNGIRPGNGRAKSNKAPPIDIVLIPKGGAPRTLRINRTTGQWLAGEDATTAE